MVAQGTRYACCGWQTVLAAVAGLSAADGCLFRSLIGTVDLRGFLALGKIEFGTDLSQDIAIAHHGAEQGQDALDGTLLDFAQTTLLIAIQTALTTAASRKQTTVLINDGNVFGCQIGHA